MEYKLDNYELKWIFSTKQSEVRRISLSLRSSEQDIRTEKDCSRLKYFDILELFFFILLFRVIISHYIIYLFILEIPRELCVKLSL